MSPPPSQPVPSTSSAPDGESEVIGAGLPLLQRLLLLKAKEEKEKNQLTPTLSNQPSSSDTISPSSIKSPLSPTIKNLSPLRKGSESSSPGKLHSPTTKTSRKNSSGSSDGTSKPKVSFKDKILQVQSDGTAVCQPLSKGVNEKPAAVVEPTPKTEGSLISIPHSVVSKIKSPAKCVGSTFREKLKILQGGGNSKESDSSSIEKIKTPVPEKFSVEVISLQTKENREELRNKKPWNKLKKAAILGDSKSKTSLEEKNTSQNICKDSAEENLSESIISISVPKINTAELVKIDTDKSEIKKENIAQDKSKISSSTPTEPVQEESLDLLTLSPNKTIMTRSYDRIAMIKSSLTKDKKYRSIDDLSPEYGGLPFVKKLKILNERQKLAELEKVIKFRSSSLDCTGSSEDLLSDTLTRSHSEGSTMDKRKFKRKSTDSVESNGSNETLERRTLKSILKKLSEDVTPTESPEKSKELRKLIRAPTVEGYAIRHSKFAKSVTFHRHTLPSPPASIPMDDSNDEVFELPASTISLPTPTASEMNVPETLETHPAQVKQTSLINNENIKQNLKNEYKLQSNLESIYDYKSLRPEEIRVPPDKPKLTIISAVANQRKLLRGNFFTYLNTYMIKKIKNLTFTKISLQKCLFLLGSIEEHEYFGDVLFGIKNVIQRHLYDVQGKFQER